MHGTITRHMLVGTKSEKDLMAKEISGERCTTALWRLTVVREQNGVG
jgi:hypothetical protein